MIKFHRPFEGYTEDQVIELDPSMEYMLVSHNFANYCPEEEPAQVVEEVKPKARAKKVKAG